MDLQEKYIINQNTVALIPKFDEYGYLITKVLEGPYSFLVRKSPLKIMEESMIYYGSELKGAMNATKEILKRISMPPVKVCVQLGMYFFPSRSHKRDDCIWFSSNHIKDYKNISSKEMIVFFKYEHTITVYSQEGKFERKIHRTQMLKSIIEDRINEQRVYLYVPQEKNVPILREHYFPLYWYTPRNESKLKNDDDKYII